MVLCVCVDIANRCPQWTKDEKLCSRNVTNEVHCFEQGRLGIHMYMYTYMYIHVHYNVKNLCEHIHVHVHVYVCKDYVCLCQ